MVSSKQLETMRQVTIEASRKEMLMDITDIRVDTELSPTARIGRFIQDVQNPYLFRVGDTAVRVQYGNQQEALQMKLKRFVLSLE